jgi:hypothetical protein
MMRVNIYTHIHIFIHKSTCLGHPQQLLDQRLAAGHEAGVPVAEGLVPEAHRLFVVLLCLFVYGCVCGDGVERRPTQHYIYIL